MWQKIKEIVDKRIITHFRDSHAPIEEICMAATVGMFWALTPLVGIQMYLVTITWLLFKLLRVQFNLPIGLALVWITNPVTMPVFYYSFYFCGVFLFNLAGAENSIITFDYFSQTIGKANAMGAWDGLIFWGKFMLYELGWPMLIGGFALGLPVSLVSYPLTRYWVNGYRKKLARNLNLTLGEWEAIHVQSPHSPKNKPAEQKHSSEGGQTATEPNSSGSETKQKKAS